MTYHEWGSSSFFHRRFALVAAGLLASAPANTWAVNVDGPLQDILVDASSGDLSNGEARGFLSRLNQFDLTGYSLRFEGGNTISLTENPGTIDATANRYSDAGLDLVGLVGPDGTLVFATDGVNCNSGGSTSTPNFDNNAIGAAESCVGAREFAESSTAALAAAVADVTTVDLFINRPTSQFMTDIRRFDRKRREEEQADNGGGSGDSDEQSLFAGPWGVYFNGGGSFGDINTSRQQTGYGLNSQFATTGFDYRFSDRVVAGFLFNYMHSGASFARRNSSMDADLYRFMPFVSVIPFENAFIDVMAGYSFHDYSSRRSAIGTSAQGDFSADQALAAINMGYTYTIGALDLTGFAGGSYIGTNVNGYSEQGNGTLLKVGGYSISSWVSTLGLELAYAQSMQFGVLKPHLRLEWAHEFENNRKGVSVVVPAQGLVVNVARGKPVSDWGKVAAGIQALLPNGIVGFVNYEAQLMNTGENHLVEGGVRLEF